MLWVNGLDPKVAIVVSPTYVLLGNQWLSTYMQINVGSSGAEIGAAFGGMSLHSNSQLALNSITLAAGQRCMAISVGKVTTYNLFREFILTYQRMKLCSSEMLNPGYLNLWKGSKDWRSIKALRKVLICKFRSKMRCTLADISVFFSVPVMDPATFVLFIGLFHFENLSARRFHARIHISGCSLYWRVD